MFGKTEVPHFYHSWITDVQRGLHCTTSNHKIFLQICKLTVNSEALMDLPEAFANFKLYISPYRKFLLDINLCQCLDTRISLK